MEISKNPWPITTTFGIKERIDTNPDFQRPAVWGQSQKQLLVDTVLRGYDIPKFYWRKVGRNPDRYEVVDGQQRLRALWEFQSGGYGLSKDAENIGVHKIAGQKYSDLPDELRKNFDIYPLDVIVLTDTDDDEVREMFLRLQNGTSLKAQEKRNAMPGNMHKFIKQLAGHKFFENCGFRNIRFAFDHVAAQMTLIELNGGPCNIKDRQLNDLYKNNQEFDVDGPKAKKIKRVLDYMHEVFPKKTPELERFSAISLYTLVSHLLERYVAQNRYKDISDWFIKFETYRRGQENLGEDKADSEIIVYREKTSHSTDAVDSLTWRHDFLMRKLFEAVPDIEQKDNQRLFTHEQRIAIFRRDKGRCQVKLRCLGEECSWDAWEADHKLAWSKGGKTTVANGQVACLSCNASKSSRSLDESGLSAVKTC